MKPNQSNASQYVNSEHFRQNAQGSGHDDFHHHVSQQLEAMMRILEQDEQTEHRSQLANHCQSLATLGQQAQIPAWVNLLETSAAVIAHPENPYRACSRLVINKIKQAQELVLDNRPHEIYISEQLAVLLPNPDPQSPTSSEEMTHLFSDELLWVDEECEETSLNQLDSDSLSSEDAIQLPPNVNDMQPAADSPLGNDLTELLNLETDAHEADLTDLTELSSLEASGWLDEISSSDVIEQDIIEQTEGSEPLDYTSLEDLSDLLDMQAPASTDTQKPPTIKKETVLSPKQRLTHCFDTFEELDTYLCSELQPVSQEPTPIPKGKDAAEWQSLESIIDRPVPTLETLSGENPVHQVGAAPSPITATKPSKSANNPAKLGTDFGDLEKLLEQADRNRGGSPTSKGVSAPSVLANRTRSHQTFGQSMRVPVKQLDNLSNLIGELVVKRNQLEQDQERLRQFLDNLLNHVQNLSDVGGRMQDLYERTLVEGALLASRSQTSGNSSQDVHYLSNLSVDNTDSQDLNALEMDRFTGFHLLSQEMIELIVRVREAASDIQFLVDETDQVSRSLRQATTQLQEGMTKSRMVPFGQTADRLPRAIREISWKLNKQAELQVEGRDVLIDKVILEHLYNPMTHLVNNAITHGIESPHEREAQGKPAAGRITIQAFLQGNQTLITVADDGAGIDAEKVKAKAIAQGLILAEEAETLSEQDIYDILFHPGFTTKDKADDFAGRGVGMDVVRTSLTEVRGSISIDSTLGKGTTFTIRLPLTLSICKALCCLSNYARIAFPMDGVEDMQEILPSEVQTASDGQRSILWHNMQLPLTPLSDLLTYNRQISRGTVYGGKQEDDNVVVVILHSAGNLLAIEVDQALGEQEIVIKQIEGPVPKPPGIAGATVLGDGSVMPIGDVLELIEISQGRLRPESSNALWQEMAQAESADAAEGVSDANVKVDPLVLIVDDSITVRELLSLSFTKAGYRVEQARDGQEAWEKLRSGLPCDIVFCDIEMPRMNGLELLSQIQKEEHLATLPVAMLTSRGAERHRNVAAKLGASGYFTKPYTEKDLLDAAQRMIDGEILLSNSSKRLAAKEPKAALAQPNRSPEAFMSMAGPQVLIVDDSVTVRELLSITFKKAGYRVEQARDGQEAWDKLHAATYDIVLCDIEMPRMNGLELLSHLQEDEQLSQIPVAMITSRGAGRHRQIAAELGAKGYFTKPYVESELLEAAQLLIQGQDLLNTLEVESSF